MSTVTRKAYLGLLLGAATLSAGVQAQDLQRGEAVYGKWCGVCHDAGRGMTGTQSLQLKYNGELPAVLLERRDLSAEQIKVFVRQGVLLMAPFRKTEITDAELDDLAAYMTGN